MKTRAVILTMGLVFALWVTGMRADVTPSPASITIPGGRQSSRMITYRLFDPYGFNSSSSTQGVFRVLINDAWVTLGTINTTVIASLVDTVDGSRGTTVESLIIPLSVVKNAEQRGIIDFQYRRNFSDGLGESILNIHLTSSSAAELQINHIRLYFKNQRAEITVKRREPDLQVFADINFTGKGLLKGYWEVDGRLISYVNKNLVYGKSLTIETPAVPALPTFTEGSHVVKFIIQRPEPQMDLPRALYYVTPGETTETSVITLLSPFDMAVLERKNPLFKWHCTRTLPVFLVEFREEENGTPVFSAYTDKTEYAIPEVVMKNRFQSPQPYYWRITGLDQEDNVAGESTNRQVRFTTE